MNSAANDNVDGTTAQTATSSTKDDGNDDEATVIHHGVRPSIKIWMIRHAESRNNEIYRDARYLYQGGTSQFDQAGWEQYIATHRMADPGLSTITHIIHSTLLYYQRFKRSNGYQDWSELVWS